MVEAGSGRGLLLRVFLVGCPPAGLRMAQPEVILQLEFQSGFGRDVELFAAGKRLGAGSGNITLKVPSQASFNLDARTSSGTLRFNSHQVTTQGTLAKNHIQGKVGNGGVLLDIHTGSGDIELQ